MSNAGFNDEKMDTGEKLKDHDQSPLEDLLDPRVKVELERLNTSTDLINKYEIKLDEARSNFRLLLNESSISVNQFAKKLGSCVEKARPYYEARMRAKQLQTQTQKAALRYERASSAHAAAKEMVYLAEEGLKKEGRCFDPAWQEMLNHATLRVNEAESERVSSQQEHQKLSSSYNKVDTFVQKLHQELKKSIVKSSLSTRRGLLQLNNLANQHQLQLLPYFEMKAQFNHLLEEQRKKVHYLEENVLKTKVDYADALHNLEEISDEIHKKRKSKDSLDEEKEDLEVEESDEFSWSNIEILYPNILKSTSHDEIYYDTLKSDEVFRSLPSRLRLRPSVINATCPGYYSQAEKQKAASFPKSQENIEPDQSNPSGSGLLKRKFNSNESVLSDDKIDHGKGECVGNKTLEKNACFMSKQMEHISLSHSDSHTPSEKILLGKEKSPDGEEMPDHKFLAADFGILRVQREEISDSESLASNDTADTLDDNQIECLLLDRVLPSDVESDLGNSFNCK